MKVYGKNVIKEILRNNDFLSNVYISKSFSDDEILEGLNKKNISYKVVENYELNKLVDGSHQGIIGDIKDYDYYDIDEIINNSKNEYPLVIILDHLEDPHNFGAIIRTCESAGVDGIIIPKDRSVLVNSTVMKVSAGALPYTKIAMVTNLVSTIKYLKKQGYFIVGTDGDGVDYKTIDYKMKTALVVGSEGSGMARLVKEECDFVASLPMKGNINSLNASVATGIMIYEIIKVNEL